MDSEQQLLNEIEKYFQNYLQGENNNNPLLVPEVDENGLAINNVTITTDEENVQIVIPAGFAPAILKGSNSTYSMPGQDGSVKEIMPAEEWYSITAEQINQGVVIVDNPITYDNGQETGITPDFNEYVWIPIENNSKFTRTAWTTKYGHDENGSFGSDEENGRTQLLANVLTLNRWWEDTETEEYQAMIISVQNYKGFYIGRYEASQGTEETAESKRNMSPWTSVVQTKAIEACINNTTTANMHLMYGVEWDTVLNWLKDNATIASANLGETKTMNIDDIQTNSSSWGNYKNSTGNAAINSGSQQNTGASEYWKANNIYDMAGNAWEWTKEQYSTSDATNRGGNSAFGGDRTSSAYRDNMERNYSYSSGGGFRASFFISLPADD